MVPSASKALKRQKHKSDTKSTGQLLSVHEKEKVKAKFVYTDHVNPGHLASARKKRKQKLSSNRRI